MENEKMTKPIIISYSELFKWQTCRRQYFYRSILDLVPVENSGAIDTGIKGHALLQTFYELIKEGKSKEEAAAVVKEHAKKLMNINNLLPDFNILKAWTLVDNYIRDNDFESEAYLVENRFLFPANRLSDDVELENVQIGFTPDIVFQRTGGRLDVEDSKFVARAWNKQKINRFQQAKLYQIFLRNMGYDVSRTILRFFNVTTATITYKSYIMEKDEEASLIHDFVTGASELAFYKRLMLEGDHTQAIRTMNYTACQFCPYEFPCSIEAEGKDASKTFNTQYKKGKYDYSK